MNSIQGAIEALGHQAKEQPGDYRQGGLLYCGACRTPKECRVGILGQERIIGCMCACETRQYESEKRAEQDRQERLRVKRLRAECLQDKHLEACRFETAKKTELIEKCRRYVSEWGRAKQENMGLLFHGGPGGGKTYAAGCIANALVDMGVPVMLTSLPKILNSGFDKADILAQLHRYPLLILDDLGVERQSEYALETVYTVIDERYKSCKPLIVTTNLSLREIRNPKSVDYARIYDRVTEMCVPVYVPQEDSRKQKGEKKLSLAREILGGSNG